MATKNVYVSKGDQVNIRYVNDCFEANATGWKEQMRPTEMTLKIEEGWVDLPFYNISSCEWPITFCSEQADTLENFKSIYGLVEK